MGGKSRKTGGVSRKLIEKIKKGDSKTNCGTSKKGKGHGLGISKKG